MNALASIGLLVTEMTIILLVALIAQALIAKSAPVRHAILLGALVLVPLCPLLNLFVRSLDIAPPLAMPNFVLPPTAVDLPESSVVPSVAADLATPIGLSTGSMLLAIWIAGTLCALVRLAHGLQTVCAMRRAAWPVSGEPVSRLVERVSDVLGCAAPPILSTNQVAVPIAIGCFRPVVLFPARLLDKLDDRQLLQVLVHESAHVTRRDPLVGLCQRILAALLWFHPLVHLANALLNGVREELCDNYVLRTATPTEYSRTLLAIARSLSSAPRALLGSAIFLSARQLEYRIVRLLTPGRTAMTSLKPWKTVAIAFSLGGGGLVLATVVASPVAIAATPATPSSSATAVGHDLSHSVPFEVGVTRLENGDSITVEEVNGTSDKMTAGNVYVIKGKYRLASQKQATLLASVTAVNPKYGEGQNVPGQTGQSVTVDQGDGWFTLVLFMAYDGNPHVSFYSTDGQPLAAKFYFGTGDSIRRRGWWEQTK